MQSDPRKAIEDAAARYHRGEITEEEYHRIVRQARRTAMQPAPTPSETRRQS